jgi:hypothetical protein
MEFPTLYKQTVTGAINKWSIFVENNYYWTEFGNINGVNQISDKVYCEAKNIGRSNETSNEQQAVLEASSLWKKKRDREGFVLSVEDIMPSPIKSSRAAFALSTEATRTIALL